MTEEVQNALSSIISQFAILGRAGLITPHGSGHIHDTYHVKNAFPAEPDYLLQRINHHVFKNIPALMENIQLVTEHLRARLRDIPGAQPDREVLTLVPTVAQQWFYRDEAGNYWRMYYFLEDTNSYDLVQLPRQAYEGGKAFGKFQALLADLPVNLLHDTIPDFHNVVNRLRLFREAIQANPKDRVKEVAAEIAFVEERAETMSTIYKMGQQGKLPLRITHNDTKFNNVLLDKWDKALCVIDLDTVMPGYVAYDFGDAIRTTVNTAPEDEPDLQKIKIDLDLFTAFAQGFLAETSTALTPHEINSLAPGVLLLPFIMGLRFLTDYIGGDTYYKIYFATHNLQRARAQFQLVRVLEVHYDHLTKIIKEVAQAAYPVEAGAKI